MLDFKKINTYPIKCREHKESYKNFAKVTDMVLPTKDPQIKELAEIIKASKGNLIVMMGAHVIKTGMSPYIIDLMKRGYIRHIAMNGASSIHDFEIAYIGQTSEDVAVTLKDGSFGMVTETGKMMHKAINHSKEGYGKAIGELCSEQPYRKYSILANAYELGIPATVHVAIGTDTIHQHPDCDGAKLGQATYDDFKIFTESVTQLEKGVLINIGSAVIMPEVFLKALSIARNLKYKVENFTTANLDMIQHYRPTENVIQRPSNRGIAITGKHQETIPSLYAILREK